MVYIIGVSYMIHDFRFKIFKFYASGHKFSKEGSKQALLNLTQDPEKVILHQLSDLLYENCNLLLHIFIFVKGARAVFNRFLLFVTIQSSRDMCLQKFHQFSLGFSLVLLLVRVEDTFLSLKSFKTEIFVGILLVSH